MIYYKTEEEIELARISSLLVCKTLGEVAKHVKPGVIPTELDKIAEEFIRDNGGTPAFKGFNGFPNSLCFSVNAEVVHGIPKKKALESGDIASIDCGVKLNGFYGDCAYTFEVGEVKEEVRLLLQRTLKSLELGIEAAKAGNRTGDIGFAVQSYVEQFNYGVVRELVGHGLGRNLHEGPEIPNYGKRGRGVQLKPGMIIAIEPMINLGSKAIKQSSDGWTIVTRDGLPSAHYEHNIAILKDKTEVLSSFKYIEETLNTN
jgi:methionyl aminopeptidase